MKSLSGERERTRKKNREKCLLRIKLWHTVYSIVHKQLQHKPSHPYSNHMHSIHKMNTTIIQIINSRRNNLCFCRHRRNLYCLSSVPHQVSIFFISFALPSHFFFLPSPEWCGAHSCKRFSLIIFSMKFFLNFLFFSIFMVQIVVNRMLCCVSH